MRELISSLEAEWRRYKTLGEGAIQQVRDDELGRDSGGNSVAVIVWHVAGNLKSRFTDFLTTDGEKPERDRDLEFEMLPGTTKNDLLAYWEQGWKAVFAAVEPLQPEDLMRTITIRGQDHTVIQAINRQLAHYAYHVGQIVYLAKHFKSTEWQSLSVPRNKSAESTPISSRGSKSLREHRERVDWMK